jgi:purine-binding chemotaxis protein CheW
MISAATSRLLFFIGGSSEQKTSTDWKFLRQQNSMNRRTGKDDCPHIYSLNQPESALLEPFHFYMLDEQEEELQMDQELELLIFETGGIRCALPLSNVIKVESAAAVSPLPNVPDVVAGILNVHGRMLPVMDVRKRFGLPSREMALDDHLILARSARRELVLWVEQVFGVELCSRAPQADALTVLEKLPYLDGVTALEGNLILICDLEKFLSASEEQLLTKAMETAAS